MSFIVVQNLGKTYSKSKQPLEALKAIDIKISKESVVGIVGPSGCGKTTLLKIFAGLISPSEGTINVNGRTPLEYRDDNGIGFVFQKPIFFPWRNLYKNLMLPTEIKRVSGTQKSKERCQTLLNLVNLSDFDTFYPKELSGGMLQRAALARALMTSPKIMLMDEPFSSVDEITKEQLWVDFRDIWEKEKLTVILVTHDIREAVFLSDDVYVMSRQPGHIVAHFPVALPKPRNIDVVSDKNFLDLQKEIRRYIN